ncbi:Txe/YoeB family addiction module toxin [Sulfurospirillum deleyianum]|uniref:Putative mRNA interferase YoeB n=1 Tax=Sulfurospirillum deleyianum (strain ATCC 51133 / DSM 6946 / 5175) TaxID=525898 RepID=D1B369_SULD5|nr:Txe/YoeB family addiction module toxin [Sulfurospirillum deleyianum]ACZ12539.1 addiction module toxin, Txe/YoeB family [Sulfurospirillum deleyianum DSM 6946]
MSQKIVFTQIAWDEYLSWQSEDKKTLKRINQLLSDIMRNGNMGIGKPERLRGDLSEYWSRRIDEKNRIVYRILEETIEVVQCKTHYADK